MNITITGNLGSGKSSVCKKLKEKGMDVISSGTLFRQIAEEKHLSVTELNELAKTDKSVDNLLDQRSTELGQKLDNTVFDSRLGWHFIPDSFKVFFIVNTNEAASRVFQDNRPTERFQTKEEAIAGLQKRASLEKERYFELYHVNYREKERKFLFFPIFQKSKTKIMKDKRNCSQFLLFILASKNFLSCTTVYDYTTTNIGGILYRINGKQNQFIFRSKLTGRGYFI